jgi:hypothetical protein
MMQFTTRELVYLGALGAATLVLAAALGTGLTAATGIPMIGGIFNAVITASVLTIGAKGVERFGAGIILWFVLSMLAIPTLTMGPPGVHKIIIGLFGGLVWDLTFLLVGRRLAGYLVAGGVMMLSIMLGVLGASIWLGLPGKERLLGAIAMLIPFNFILGLIGTYLGFKLFDAKVSEVGYVQRMLLDRQDSEKAEV